MDTIHAIAAFLDTNQWVLLDDPEEQITFLAAGEYNENYRISVSELYGQADYVFRINHGTQLGLTDQIEYEFAVLRALSRSGVTPRPFFVDPAPKTDGLGNGVLLMEYLPGRPLDYALDRDDAAAVFANIHAQPANVPLIRQDNPITAICDESEGMLARYPDHPMRAVRQRLTEYAKTIRGLAAEAAPLFRDDPPVLVNTEVNSRNFIVDDDGEDKHVWLVDWEKAVISSRFQDLGHFLVPTTTLWKSDYRFTPDGKAAFLAAYLDAAGLSMSLEQAVTMTDLMERTILLRALSWCYMAHHEYTVRDRALQNRDTFEKITAYLDGMECFLTPVA